MLVKYLLLERDKNVFVQGWVDKRVEISNEYFYVSIKDGSTHHSLQCFFEKKELYDFCFEKIKVNCLVRLEGFLNKNHQLIVKGGNIISENKIYDDFLKCREKNQLQSMLTKSKIKYEINHFFKEKDFIWIENNDEKFYFNKMVQTFQKIFTINEEGIIKVMIGFINFEDLLEFVEEFILFLYKILDKEWKEKKIVKKSYKNCFTFLKKEVECCNIVINPKSETILFEDGLLVLQEFPKFGDDFTIPIIKYLVREFGNKPFMMIHHPRNQKNIYSKINETNTDIVDTLDVFVPNKITFLEGGMKEDNRNVFTNLYQDKEYEKFLQMGCGTYGGFECNIYNIISSL